ncbi:MAG: DUF349 domain-containing protein [Pontibacterium sp.]
MLLRFFKPRWQHPNAEIRLKAVSAMDADTDQQNDILKSIVCNDEHPDVRFEALLKISDIDLIIGFGKERLQGNKHLSYQQHLCEQLCVTANLTDAQAAVALIGEQDLLLHLVIHAQNKAIAEAALTAIESEEALAAVIRSSQVAVSARRAAAKRIEDIELIERLAKELQGKDKQTYRTLKSKLDEHRAQQKQIEASHMAAEALVAKLEHLNSTEVTQHFEAKFLAFKKQWQTLLGQITNEDLIHSGEVALSQCDVRLTQLQQQQQAEAEQQEKLQLAQATHAEVLQNLTSLQQTLVEQLHNDFENSSLSQLTIELKTQLDALTLTWHATELPAISQSQAGFDQQVEKVKGWLTALERYGSLETQVNDALPAVAPTDAKTLISKISWPNDLPQPSALAQLTQALQQQSLDAKQKKAEQKAKSKESLETLNQAIRACEEAIGRGKSRDAIRRLKDVDKIVKSLAKLPAATDHHYKNLTAQVRSLESWSGYAAEPKKQQLCEQMEALIHSDMAADAKAEKIKGLQKEWRLIDATDPVHSHQLWSRFKQASDQAYEPCEAYFKEQREVRKHNLVLREALINELEQGFANTPLEDWPYKAAAELLSVSRKTWREYRPVDRSPGKKSQQAFDHLCKQMESHLSDIRDQHHEAKLALLAEVGQIIANEEITSEHLETVKQLQGRWKKLGQELPHQDRKLWKQFKAQCNQAFDTFKGQQASHNRFADNLDALVNDLSRAIEQPCSLTRLSDLVAQVETQLSHPEATPAEQKRLQAAAKPVKQLVDQAQALQTPEYQAIERFAVLSQQLEDAVVEGASNDAVEPLKAAWQSGLRAPEPYQSMLDARFAFAEAALDVNDDQLKAAVLDQEKRIRHLCIRLEIALSLPSPDEDQAQRMEYQMSRLQHSLSHKTQSFDITDVIHLEYEWLCIPFAAHFETLHHRFQEALDHIS